MIENKKLIEEFKKRIQDLESPKRIALSSRYPKLKGVIIFTRQSLKNLENFFTLGLGCRLKKSFLPIVIARHQSVLVRKLGDSDISLQHKKITNLRQAVKKLDGLVIAPGKTFSLWYEVGRPTKGRGYTEGMLLANGRTIEGIGGGLCQLSNFLCWILLHCDVKIIERYHHAMDVFPDSGRVLPFGSGATILYNFVDLKIKNTGDQPIQLKLWLTDKHLKGQVLADKPTKKKIHLFEKNHCFIKYKNKYYRYNEIWREILINGKKQKEELVFTNFAPVLYLINDNYIKKNNFKLIEI